MGERLFPAGPAQIANLGCGWVHLTFAPDAAMAKLFAD
jgi:hypothetical protein